MAPHSPVPGLPMFIESRAPPKPLSRSYHHLLSSDSMDSTTPLNLGTAPRSLHSSDSNSNSTNTNTHTKAKEGSTPKSMMKNKNKIFTPHLPGRYLPQIAKDAAYPRLAAGVFTVLLLFLVGTSGVMYQHDVGHGHGHRAEYQGGRALKHDGNGGSGDMGLDRGLAQLGYFERRGTGLSVEMDADSDGDGDEQATTNRFVEGYKNEYRDDLTRQERRSRDRSVYVDPAFYDSPPPDDYSNTDGMNNGEDEQDHINQEAYAKPSTKQIEDASPESEQGDAISYMPDSESDMERRQDTPAVPVASPSPTPSPTPKPQPTSSPTRSAPHSESTFRDAENVRDPTAVKPDSEGMSMQSKDADGEEPTSTPGVAAASNQPQPQPQPRPEARHWSSRKRGQHSQVQIQSGQRDKPRGSRIHLGSKKVTTTTTTEEE